MFPRDYLAALHDVSAKRGGNSLLSPAFCYCSNGTDHARLENGLKVRECAGSVDGWK